MVCQTEVRNVSLLTYDLLLIVRDGIQEPDYTRFLLTSVYIKTWFLLHLVGFSSIREQVLTFGYTFEKIQ